jgi:hypothetical protein
MIGKLFKVLFGSKIFGRILPDAAAQYRFKRRAAGDRGEPESRARRCRHGESDGFPAMLKKLLGRLRRRSRGDPWQLAREVVLARTARFLTGTLSAAEARRMVLEKLSAGVRAHIAYALAVLDGEPAAASHAFFEVYRREVRANRKRLAQPLARRLLRLKLWR